MTKTKFGGRASNQLMADEIAAPRIPQPAPIDRPAPVIPNEDQFTKLDPIERANVVKPIVEIGERYKRAFGGWRLLGEVMASQEQTPALWSGAALMCRAADDRRGTQFATLMAVVADSVRLEVLKALR